MLGSKFLQKVSKEAQDKLKLVIRSRSPSPERQVPNPNSTIPSLNMTFPSVGTTTTTTTTATTTTIPTTISSPQVHTLPSPFSALTPLLESHIQKLYLPSYKLPLSGLMSLTVKDYAMLENKEFNNALFITLLGLLKKIILYGDQDIIKCITHCFEMNKLSFADKEVAAYFHERYYPIIQHFCTLIFLNKTYPKSLLNSNLIYTSFLDENISILTVIETVIVKKVIEPLLKDVEKETFFIQFINNDNKYKNASTMFLPTISRVETNQPFCDFIICKVLFNSQDGCYSFKIKYKDVKMNTSSFKGKVYLKPNLIKDPAVLQTYVSSTLDFIETQIKELYKDPNYISNRKIKLHKMAITEKQEILKSFLGDLEHKFKNLTVFSQELTRLVTLAERHAFLSQFNKKILLDFFSLDVAIGCEPMEESILTLIENDTVAADMRMIFYNDLKVNIEHRNIFFKELMLHFSEKEYKKLNEILFIEY